MTVPDVTVLIAAYNAMPYLERTLDSLIAQSIGFDRLEIIAVDDGSTDDTGEALDKCAARFPDTVQVIHQANSGGPAGPWNRGLDLATGRFVYFVGADDYLGPEALERLVTYADEHDSDVVMGKVVGVNGLEIEQRVFKGNVPDLPPYGPDLRWSMANTHLYRRDLVERIGLRYVEHLPFGSDQPFMVEACANARRISVVGDYTCYYAVPRENLSNISFATGYPERMRCIAQLMEIVERVTKTPEERDTILVRHFTWEVPRLLRRYFLAFSTEQREEMCRDVSRLVERFMTDRIRSELRVVPRVLLDLAVQGEVDLLEEMLRAPEGWEPSLHVVGGEVYAAYPGFSVAAPVDAYRVPDQGGFRGRLLQGIGPVSATWGGRRQARRLTVTVPTNIVDRDNALAVEMVLRGADAQGAEASERIVVPASDVRVAGAAGDACVIVTARLDPTRLCGPGRLERAWRADLRFRAGDYTVTVPVPGASAGKVRMWTARALCLVWAEPLAGPGQPALMVRANRVPPKGLLRAAAAKLPLPLRRR